MEGADQEALDFDQIPEHVKKNVETTNQWSGKSQAYAPEIVDHYNKEAASYEEMYLTMGYHDHEKVNEIACELIPNEE